MFIPKTGICRCLLVLLAARVAAGIVEKVDAIDQARVVGPGLRTSEVSLEVGHLRLDLTSGKLFPIVVGDRVEGAFFEGEGRFVYTSADPFEAAVFRSNVKRATPYAVQDGVLSAAVSRLIFWGSSYLDSLPEWPQGDSSTTAQTSFAKFREKRANDPTAVEVLLAHGLLESADEPLAIVELGADKKDLLYVFDTGIAQSERLVALEKFNFGTEFTKRLRIQNTLSVQPIGRVRLSRPSPGYRLIDVDAEVVNPEGDLADVEVQEIYDFAEPTKILYLDLMSWNLVEGVRKDYRLTSVTDEDGIDLPFVHRQGSLIVELPEAEQKGAHTTLRFAMSGPILNRPRGDNYWRLGPGGWLPEPPWIEADFHTYRVVTKVPKPFVPFSNGKTVRRWEEGDFACAEFREEHPIFLPVILAGKYKSYEQTHEGVTIQVHAYAQAKQARMEQLANNLFALMEFYAKVLGEYPFPELKVIEINELGWGQAPPGIIFITREAFLPGHSEEARGWSQGINARLAHELAHTWWGDISPWASAEDYWLCESTADYYAAVAMSMLWRKSEFEKEVKKWREQSVFLGDNGTVLLANQLSTQDGFRDRFALLYAKGPLVLHALRQEIGDQAFFTTFKTLLSNRQFQHISTSDVISILNHVTGKDYTDWFGRYIGGTEWPAQVKKKKKKKKG